MKLKDLVYDTLPSKEFGLWRDIGGAVRLGQQLMATVSGFGGLRSFSMRGRFFFVVLGLSLVESPLALMPLPLLWRCRFAPALRQCCATRLCSVQKWRGTKKTNWEAT